MYSSIRR
ncbi:Protein of unknown function [Pyronema omphalodes CBS 100304]|nr:Protein of unknown function [Pyronema omphalodes CBS 100304]